MTGEAPPGADPADASPSRPRRPRWVTAVLVGAALLLALVLLLHLSGNGFGPGSHLP